LNGNYYSFSFCSTYYDVVSMLLVCTITNGYFYEFSTIVFFQEMFRKNEQSNERKRKVYVDFVVSSPRKLDIRSASKTLLTYSASSKDAALFRLFCFDLTDRTSAFGKSNVDSGLLRARSVFCNVN
ncbi:hypothetical protein T08_7809, partial [Trichinella sp. T8]